MNPEDNFLDLGCDTIVVLVAADDEKTFRGLVRPVCLVQGYDLVLPNVLPEQVGGQDWSLLRTGGIVRECDCSCCAW
jgi:hypothetical protein